MNEFKEKYIDLINVWINGNHVSFYVNDVSIGYPANFVKFDGDELLFNECLHEDKNDFYPSASIKFEKVYSMRFYVSCEEYRKYDEGVCLKIFKENDKWQHEIIFPTESKEK